ncbi:MAG: antitoxin [Patescibacteria group bacterium]
MKTKLTKKTESEFLNLFEAGKLGSVRDLKNELARYRQAAKFTTQKTRSINIRLAQKDMTKIKTLAAKHGLPYQTFVTSILHKISADG